MHKLHNYLTRQVNFWNLFNPPSKAFFSVVAIILWEYTVVNMFDNSQVTRTKILDIIKEI